MPSQRIFAGQTTPGITAWQDVPGGDGIYVDVDTSGGQFLKTPTYLTSLGGTQHHWITTGGNSACCPTAKSFRIYLRSADGNPLTSAVAVLQKWHINWMGIEVGSAP